MAELQEFLRSANERGRTHLLLHCPSRGLFHSKLYVVRRSERTQTYIGSANATYSAFGNNEEILLEICGVHAPNTVESYLQSLLRTGTRLEQEANKFSLEHFLRDARLVFKPTRSDPFRIQLRPIGEAIQASEQALGLVYSKTGAAFSLWSALQLDEDTDAQVPGEAGTLIGFLRPRAIETAYGFWVPEMYVEKLRPHFQQAERQQAAKLGELKKRLSEREVYVREQFMSALKEIDGRGIPFTEEARNERVAAFERFVVTAKKRLASPEWVNSHARRYYLAIVPDLFAEAESREDFLSSFLYDLELRIGQPGGRRGRIIRAIEQGIRTFAPDVAREPNAFQGEEWFLRALTTMLSADAFSPEELWADT